MRLHGPTGFDMGSRTAAVRNGIYRERSLWFVTARRAPDRQRRRFSICGSGRRQCRTYLSHAADVCAARSPGREFAALGMRRDRSRQVDVHARLVLSWLAGRWSTAIGLLVISVCSFGRSRGGPQAVAAPQPPPVEFVGQWGDGGNNPGQLNQPVGLAVDAAGRVYVANRGRGSVQKFEARGVPLLSFEDRAVSGASGIAVDSGGAIYVANARAGEILVFFPKGDLLRVLHIAPQRAFEGALGFSVDADGAIFVPDPAGGRVQVLDSHGRIEKVWKVPSSGNGKPARPVAAMVGPDNCVYVGDSQSGYIEKFTRSGQLAGSWGEPGNDAPIRSLAVSAKYVFVLRGASPYLELWTLDGRRVVED